MDYGHADALNEAIHSIGLRHRQLATRALAGFGIHPGHKLVLFELAANGPSSQAALAAACGFEPPTITLQVRQLEELGFVARRPSPTDKRSILVELTADGRSLLPKVRAAWRRVADDTVAGLRSLDTDALIAVLADLAGSLEARDAPDETTVRRPSATSPARRARS